MTARPPAASNPYGLAVWERIGIGLIGLAAAAGMLWATFIAIFILSLGADPECGSLRDAPALAIGASFLVAWAIGLCWLIVASLMSLAVRLRGIRGSRWLAVPAAFIALTAIAYGYAVAQPAAEPITGACPPIYE